MNQTAHFELSALIALFENLRTTAGLLSNVDASNMAFLVPPEERAKAKDCSDYLLTLAERMSPTLAQKFGQTYTPTK